MSSWRSTDDRQLETMHSIRETVADIKNHQIQISNDQVQVMAKAIDILTKLTQTNQLMLDEMACMRKMIARKLNELDENSP